MYRRRSGFYNTILLLYVFVLPHTIYTIIDLRFNFIYLSSILILFIPVCLKLKNILIYGEVLAGLVLILAGVLLQYLFKGQIAKGALLFVPLITYVGILFYRQNEFDLKLFKWVLILMYAYFYIIYYSKLPSLFYRPGFDEDAIVFERASSNGISVALNMTLWIWSLLSFRSGVTYDRKLAIFSFFNLLLIVIQQSRGGIAFAILLFFLNLGSSGFRILRISLLFLVSIYAFKFNILSLVSYDIRFEVAYIFLTNLDSNYWFLGSNIVGEFKDGITYTFNVFLDLWNNSWFFSAIFFFVYYIRGLVRIRGSNIYKFLLPVSVYFFTESFFIVEYWDVFLFLILFPSSGQRL